MSVFTSTNLCSNWEFKQIDAVGVPIPSEEFLPVSQFPTNIHLDLLAHNLIPDPFIGLNEYKVQWVGEQKWLYRTTFAAPSALPNEKIVLQFNGLDTFALVSLNDTQILLADNMHRNFRVEVSDTIKESNNVLEILFDSAIIRGKKLMQERDFKPAGFTSSTDKSRLLVRKAQYHYAWNWGPELTTCGPWRPIFLERYSTRISDLWTKVDISVTNQTADLSVWIEIEGELDGVSVAFTLLDPEQNTIATRSIELSGNGPFFAQFKVEHASFWWPVGLGKQPLYTVRAELIHKNTILQQVVRYRNLDMSNFHFRLWT